MSAFLGSIAHEPQGGGPLAIGLALAFVGGSVMFGGLAIDARLEIRRSHVGA